ncbi:Transcriptional regulator, XRE family [Hyella patelloides LEGE 07179]|uniref:Transcriptional regulator, XRE family n=2 Tax=Hyella TaxID=945733 RepID=A0A563VQL6_9CYAN|nr:Transcriptional regulator, XRE family [Hyella patelloides LEGE 07179]
MSQFRYEQNRIILASLMEQVAISNMEELSDVAGVSELQIRRLQYGLIYKISVETLVKLAAALEISIEQMLAKFTEPTESSDDDYSTSIHSQPPQVWQQEYQKLEQEMAQQTEMLKSQFQQTSIQAIESWLIQWPTAVAAIEKNPELPAKRLIPLVKPVKELVEQWGIKTISTVGEELPYDPQWHELMTGSVEPGTKVKVRYVGYTKEDRILYKAKVSPVEAL